MAQPIYSHEQPRELYYPDLATITTVKKFTPLEIFFRLKFHDGHELNHQPGQFVQVSLFGHGEAPFSICSSPTQPDSFDLCVRKIGMLTEALHNLSEGTTVGIRGPYGQGFDVEGMKGHDILIIGGGIGIVPLRSLINYIIHHRNKYGRVIILYGARTPGELLFPDETRLWSEDNSIEFHVTVDRGAEDWNGHTGVITTLIPPLDLDLSNTRVAVVGPPVMYKFVLMTLKSKRIPDDNIYLSLERHMKCGVGKCGHCQINHSYVCQDGPVYRYPFLKTLPEAI